MYAPPTDFSQQLMDMMSAGKPGITQPGSFNVPNLMPEMPQQGGGDSMNLGSIGDSYDLTSLLMDQLGGSAPLGSQPISAGTPDGAWSAMQKMPTGGTFNAQSQPASMLTNQLTQSPTWESLSAMLGL